MGAGGVPLTGNQDDDDVSEFDIRKVFFTTVLSFGCWILKQLIALLHYISIKYCI